MDQLQPSTAGRHWSGTATHPRIDDASSEVNLLNENGITTVFNSYRTGLRLWGNRTAAWPSVTHLRSSTNNANEW